MNLVDMDDRPFVTVFIAYGYNEDCAYCGFDIEAGDEACYEDDGLVHFDCVSDHYRRR